MYIKMNVTPEKAALLEKLLSDDAFASSLVTMQSAEEVQVALKEKGLDLTIEEINSLAKALNEASATDKDLSAEELDNVAGGFGAINIWHDQKRKIWNVTLIW